METMQEISGVVGIAGACEALGINRATHYRRLHPSGRMQRSWTPEHAISEEERRWILDLLRSERFCDKTPYEIYGTLLDEGIYWCSIRTMYRLLEEVRELRERRNQLRHPQYEKPELLAVKPNEVWSWDITKLLGPAKWTYYYLYVILDIFSRYVVGWMVAYRESAKLAERLIQDTCGKQGIAAGELTLHADRGSSMKSKMVAQLLVDLGITKTHSRPHVSDDNPYSEAQFKTMKYRPEFPNRFGSIEDARSFCRAFFRWYNTEHRHTGIGLMTPEAVHTGRTEELTRKRQQVLDAAFRAHPARFRNKRPKAPQVPKAAWINPPDRSGKRRRQEPSGQLRLPFGSENPEGEGN